MLSAAAHRWTTIDDDDGAAGAGADSPQHSDDIFSDGSPGFATPAAPPAPSAEATPAAHPIPGTPLAQMLRSTP